METHVINRYKKIVIIQNCCFRMQSNVPSHDSFSLGSNYSCELAVLHKLFFCIPWYLPYLLHSSWSTDFSYKQMNSYSFNLISHLDEYITPKHTNWTAISVKAFEFNSNIVILLWHVSWPGFASKIFMSIIFDT